MHAASVVKSLYSALAGCSGFYKLTMKPKPFTWDYDDESYFGELWLEGPLQTFVTQVRIVGRPPAAGSVPKREGAWCRTDLTVLSQWMFVCGSHADKGHSSGPVC